MLRFPRIGVVVLQLQVIEPLGVVLPPGAALIIGLQLRAHARQRLIHGRGRALQVGKVFVGQVLIRIIQPVQSLLGSLCGSRGLVVEGVESVAGVHFLGLGFQLLLQSRARRLLLGFQRAFQLAPLLGGHGLALGVVLEFELQRVQLLLQRRAALGFDLLLCLSGLLRHLGGFHCRPGPVIVLGHEVATGIREVRTILGPPQPFIGRVALDLLGALVGLGQARLFHAELFGLLGLPRFFAVTGRDQLGCGIAIRRAALGFIHGQSLAIFLIHRLLGSLLLLSDDRGHRLLQHVAIRRTAGLLRTRKSGR